MRDRPKFRVSGSRIKLKASCTARNEAQTEEHDGKKSKMERRRIRQRFTKIKKDE